LAREQRQKKDSAAHSDATKQKTFSNLEDPQPQAITPNGRTARNATPRPDMPVSLSEVNFPSLIMEAPGQTYNLLILAHFSDGSMLDTTESGRLTFHSTDAKIVTVDATGTVVAVATGMASIVVSYGNPKGPDLQLKIPVTVLRFQVTFSPSALDFGSVQVGRSAMLSLTATNNSFSDMHLMIKAVTASGPYSETDIALPRRLWRWGLRARLPQPLRRLHQARARGQ
jgi:Big-like domain-containing protein